MDEVRQGAERLVDVGRVIGPVDLVEVDPVGAETAQAVLAGVDDVAPTVAGHIGRRGGVERTGRHRKRHFVARMTSSRSTAGERLGDDLLALAGRVDVGGVDEVDPGVEGTWMMATQSSWSRLPNWPNIMAPRHRLETCIPVWPRVR